MPSPIRKLPDYFNLPFQTHEEKMRFYWAYLTHNEDLFESNSDAAYQKFEKLSGGVCPESGKKYLFLVLTMYGDSPALANSDGVIPILFNEVDGNDTYRMTNLVDGKEFSFPRAGSSINMPLKVLFFDSVESYNLFRTEFSLKYEAGVLPDATNSELLENKSRIMTGICKAISLKKL